jgi:hypothetical protein
MTRHSVTATPVFTVWASVESAARAAARHFTVQADPGNALAMIEHEQNQIRQTGRHWLIG